MKTALLWFAACLLLSQGMNAQQEIELFRDLLPAPLLESAEYRRQISETLRAKGDLDPSILEEYISYLHALGRGAPAESLSVLRATAFAAEMRSRRRRTDWAQRQRDIIGRLDADAHLAHAARLCFADDDTRSGVDTSGAGSEPAASPRRNILAVRWLSGGAVGRYGPTMDGAPEYDVMRRAVRRRLTDESMDASSVRCDELIDSITGCWYLFEDDAEELHSAAELVYRLIRLRRTESAGGGVTVMAGFTPTNPIVNFTTEAYITGYGPYSLAMDLNDRGQWYAGVRLRIPLKEYASPLSYAAVDVTGSFSPSDILDRRYESRHSDYSVDGMDIGESLTMVWDRIHVTKVHRIVGSLSVPLYVPLDNLSFEGGVAGGIQRYHVHIDYWYHYRIGQWLPNKTSGHLFVWRNDTRTGTLDFDRTETLFLPLVSAVWRPFKPLTVHATVAINMWLVKAGVEFY